MPLPQQNQNIRGVKRKGLDDKESEEGREAKLHRKLHHALRGPRKIVKKVRAFEIQKTLKKLKVARHKDSESDVTKDLVAQLEVLKHLSYDQLARSALMTKLKKDKILSADLSMQGISTELTSNTVSPGAPGTAATRVQSRILSSKVLASEVALTVETLRKFMNSSVGADVIGEATDDSQPSSDISKKRKAGAGHKGNEISSIYSVANPFSGEGTDEENENASGEEATAGVDDGWESGTVGAPSGSDASVAGSADDRDTSSDDSNDGKCGDEGGSSSGNLKSRKSQPHKGQSEFLPSLSVGFVRADSDSEFSDREMRFVDGIKKNRRGQRARRAIWEKKFGKNANHVKKRQQEGTVRGSKRHLPDSVRTDRRSGKVNTSSRLPHTLTRFRAPIHGHEQVHKQILAQSEGVNNMGLIGAQSDRMRCKGDSRENQGERPLHPSWEAKVKQRAASILPSQGMKTVFSEP